MQNQACGTKTSPVQSRVGGWVGGHCRQKKKEKRLDPLHNTPRSQRGGGVKKSDSVLTLDTATNHNFQGRNGNRKKESYSILVSSTEMITIFVSKTNREQKRFSVFPPQVQSGKSRFKGGWRKKRRKKRQKKNDSYSCKSQLWYQKKEGKENRKTI